MVSAREVLRLSLILPDPQAFTVQSSPVKLLYSRQRSLSPRRWQRRLRKRVADWTVGKELLSGTIGTVFCVQKPLFWNIFLERLFQNNHFEITLSNLNDRSAMEQNIRLTLLSVLKEETFIRHNCFVWSAFRQSRWQGGAEVRQCFCLPHICACVLFGDHHLIGVTS